MVDVVITASDVDKVSGSQRTNEAGIAITAGQTVYLDAAGLVQLCQNDLTAVEGACVGISLNDAGVGQPCTYQVSGVIDLGSVLAAGVQYIVGAAAGAVAPVADIASTEFLTSLGVGISTTELQIGINQSGVAAA